MSNQKLTILSGLSVTIANVMLVAVIDEQAKSVRIVQRGETLNGNGAAIETAMMLLAGRAKRVRPDLRVM